MATYSEYLDSKPLPKRGWRRIRRHLPRLSVLLMTLLLIAIVLWPYVVVSVPTGQVGVLWYRLIGFDPYCMCLVRGTVLDPRAVLMEFGVALPDSTTIRVWDSTAEIRYLVLPMRPAGTEGWSEERLADLVTRDSMIGTGLPKQPHEVA